MAAQPNQDYLVLIRIVERFTCVATRNVDGKDAQKVRKHVDCKS